MSAALGLARACRRVVVVDAGRPRNASSEHLHGYLTRDGMNPSELLDIGQAEVCEVGGEIHHGCVTALTRGGPESFMAILDDGSTVESRAASASLKDESTKFLGPATNSRSSSPMVREFAVRPSSSAPASPQQMIYCAYSAAHPMIPASRRPTAPDSRTSPECGGAGNVNDSPAQLINAASAGSRAAIALNHHFLAYDIEHAWSR